MKHNKNFISDIEKLQKIEQKLYDKLKSIGDHKPKKIKCADGFSGPNDKGECIGFWSAKCGMECHKKKCAASGGKWIPKNYMTNPYTCKPSSEKSEKDFSENEEKKKEIMRKINEISQIRINLYQQLKDKFNNKRFGLIRNYSNLKDKATILYNTEKKMNLIKKEINSKKHLLESKIRVIEINEKLLDEEIINKKVLKIIFFICFLIVLAILLGKIPAVPQALTYLLVTLILVFGTIRILKLKYYQYAEDGLYRKDYYYIGTNEPTSFVLNNNENSYESPDISNVLGGLKDDYSAITDGRFTDNTVVEFDAYENFQPNDLKYTGSVSSV